MSAQRHKTKNALAISAPPAKEYEGAEIIEAKFKAKGDGKIDEERLARLSELERDLLLVAEEQLLAEAELKAIKERRKSTERLLLEEIGYIEEALKAEEGMEMLQYMEWRHEQERGQEEAE